jgi:hypothetical protein
MSEEALLQELDNSLISPDRYFKNQKLAPYTEGSRLLMLQVRDDSDSAIYFVWSFIYLHILLAEDRKKAIRLAWDKDAFREKLMDWIAEMSEEDRNTASLMCSSILSEANKARVNVIPSAIAAPPGNA